MRALVCEEWCHYSKLKIMEVAPPAIRADCLRIRVHFSTVSFGQTLLVAGTYQRKPPRPFSPGTEVAGVVSEVGPGVTRFAVGDRVVAGVDWGGYAEEVIATVETTWPVPDTVGLDTAVSVPLTYGTAWAALFWRAKLAAGQTLVVFGAAGGVGHAAVELGAAMGVKVIAVASSGARLNHARTSGARICIENGPDLGKRILAANNGQPVDVVFDPVGGELFGQGLKCTAPEGKVVVVGFASGTIPPVPANILLVKNIEVIGLNFSYYIGWSPVDERKRYAPRLAETMTALFELILAGKVRPVASEVYPLEQTVEAFDKLLARRIQGRALISLGA
ncbi:MAG: NADPH:quinone oxidoreductase family protein [Jhaorihella sp.]